MRKHEEDEDQDEGLEEIDEPGSSVQKEKTGRDTDSPDDLEDVGDEDEEENVVGRPTQIDEHGVLQPLDQGETG